MITPSKDKRQSERQDHLAQQVRSLALRGHQDDEVEGDGDERSRADGCRERDGERRAGRQEAKSHEGSEGRDRPMREVQDSSRAVDEHDPERHQRIEAPGREPGQGVLEEPRHALTGTATAESRGAP
jgi:hypothetical protein